jgi:hypothetical protein
MSDSEKREKPVIKEVLDELFPPGIPKLVRWRMAIFAFGVGTFFFILWCVSPYGFVRADDFNALKANVSDVQVTLLEQSIFSAKDSECLSTDESARLYFRTRVFSLSREYYKLTGLQSNIPPCKGS